jgi:hypothetical protein
MIQAFSHIFSFFNIASPCGDMANVASPRQPHELTPKENKDRKAEKNMFYMVLTLCTISLISRVLLMAILVYLFNV